MSLFSSTLHLPGRLAESLGVAEPSTRLPRPRPPLPRRLAESLGVAGFLVVAISLAGCDGKAPPPGEHDGGTDAGRPDVSVVPDGAVPCEFDAECDDGIACTRDLCDATYRFCRHDLDGAMCDDGVFCNGVETCDPRQGCVAGARTTCDDDDVCTLDRCNEELRRCDHFPRDLDEDGDVDFFCDGNDCDDRDPTRSSRVAEVCGDAIDNDCDATVDERTCGGPPHDNCDDPLDVSAGGVFVVDITGATPDHTLGCVGAPRPDVVLRLTLDAPRDVTIEAEGDLFTTAIALRSSCADRSSELECSTGFPGVIRRRALAPGTYYVIVTGYGTGEIAVSVGLAPPTPPPSNDSCAAPFDVSAGGTYRGSMLDVRDDLTTGCGFSGSPDLVYTFTTTEERDVRVSASSTTGESMAWEIRPACGSTAGALRCAYGSPASGRVHQLPAGTYFLIVEGPGYAEVDFQLDVELLPPTPHASGDLCAAPIPLALGVRTPGSLMEMEDDVETTCGFRYRDAVYSFTLSARRDVTVEVDGGTRYMNASLRTSCADVSSELRCTAGAPVRMRLRDLAPGTYFVVVESSAAPSFAITVTDAPPTTPTVVTGNDTCATAYAVPETGGLYTGDTRGLADDYRTAACGAMAQSPDAAFRLELTARRRVVATTEGSSFDTVLHMHPTMCRTGSEAACDDDGGDGTSSLLDRTLDPGVYYYVVDGWGMGSSGTYVLDLQVSDPES